MRILLISHGYPPESIGGVEQHVDGLAGALVAAGHHVSVYARTGERGAQQGGHLPERVDARGVRITRVVYRYEGLDELGSLYAVPTLDAAFENWLAAHEPFDVAHVHHLTGMSTGLLDVLRARHIPSLLTLHDYWLICPRGQMWRSDGEVCAAVEPTRCAECLRPTFGGWLPEGIAGDQTIASLHANARRTLAAASALAVPSERAIPPFEQLGIPRTRIHVVENGVDTTALERVPPLTEERENPRPLRVGFLGTLIPSKGLDVLVAAMLTLPRGSARLDVFGNAVPYHGEDGYLTKVFSRLEPHRTRVAYHGPYSTAELPSIFEQIDVLVAPALWAEAFGLTVREALAARRPVIASRIGGLQDAFRDGIDGIYVDPGSVEQLAAAIRGLAADRGRLLELAQGGASRPASRGFGAMASDLLDIYLELGPHRA